VWTPVDMLEQRDRHHLRALVSEAYQLRQTLERAQRRRLAVVVDQAAVLGRIRRIETTLARIEQAVVAGGGMV